MATEEWFNQNWVIAGATLSGALFAGLVLLRQLTALNRKNKFDLLQYVAKRMSQRFDPPVSPETRRHRKRRPSSRSVRESSGDGRPDLVATGKKFYALKNRFRGVISTLPEEVRNCRGHGNHLRCLAARIAVIRDLPRSVRQEDFETIRQYVNAVNDVAEMVEAGLVDVGYFLGKYHLALVREVYIAEPYICYLNLYTSSGRWGMRVLRVGEMARNYNDISPIHRQPIFFRDDVEFGPIYGALSGRLVRAKKCLWFVQGRLSLYPSLNARSKRRQTRFLDLVRRELEAPDS